MKITQKSETCKKTFLPLSADTLAELKRLEMIENHLYVIQTILLRNPYRRVHRFQPTEHRQRIGSPWGGIMPERSFNKAIADLTKKGAISGISKDNHGWWLMEISHDFYSLYDPARNCPGSKKISPSPATSCREPGRPLPEESLEPLTGGGFDPPKIQHDRYLKNQYLKEQENMRSESETGSDDVVVFSTNVDPEAGVSSDRPENSAHKALANKGKPVYSGGDYIFRAAAASGADAEFVVEKVIPRASDSEKSALSRVIRRAEPDVVLNAIEALKQQWDAVRMPGRWLIGAIKRGFTPNATPEVEKRRDTGIEWRNLADDLGLIQSSMRSDAPSGLDVNHFGNWMSIDDAQKIWPLRWLQERPSSFGCRIESIRTNLERGIPVAPEEFTELGVRLEGWFVVPIEFSGNPWDFVISGL